MVMMVIEHFIQRERISTQAVSPTLNIRITVNLGSLEPHRDLGHLVSAMEQCNYLPIFT